MTYLAKAALFCDHCKAKVECAPEAEPTLGFDLREDSPLKGWINVGLSHHLCANCAKAYLAKRSELERELKEEYLNDTNEFTL